MPQNSHILSILLLLLLSSSTDFFAECAFAQAAPPNPQPDIVGVIGQTITPANANALSNDTDPYGAQLTVGNQPPTYTPLGIGGIGWLGGISFTATTNGGGTAVIPYRVFTTSGRNAWSDVTFIIQPMDGANNAGAFCQSVGQPVNVTTGNMWIEHSDYSLPGIGEPIQINRFYNSVIQSSGLFGFGWSTKYDESIWTYGDKMLRLNLPDGRAVYFGRINITDPFSSVSLDFQGQIVQNADNTYTLTFKDGRVHKFDQTGGLLWQKDRNGNQTTLGYDVNGNLVTITDASGRVLTLTPNANGNVETIADSIGTVATYEYVPGNSRLQTVTYADGSKYKFEYDTVTVPGKAFLTTVKDALDNVLETHVYDTSGRATTSEKHGGVEKYEFDYSNANASPPYTLVKHKKNAADPYIETKYYFDKNRGRNLITKTEGLCSCGGSGSEVTQYFYDDQARLTKTIDALGQETLYTYDADRNITQIVDPLGTQKWTYNALGQVLTYKDRIDSSGVNNTSVNTYDTNGNLTTVTDALGKVTTVEYPTTNNKGLPDSVKDARNNVTKFKWFSNSGLLDEIEDPYTKKTKFTYDTRGRTKTVTNALTHVTQYNYFDDTQRKVEMIYPNLDKITYKYDIRRLLESVTDERGKITGYEFDSAYRLKKITDPLGHFKELGYDLMSNMTSYKDPLGNITDYRYDDFNRLSEVEYPAAIVGATRLKEKFEYDQLGRIKKVTDTANRDTTYAYDLVNRTVTVTNAELEATQTKYNQRLQTIEVKDALNQTYQFSYDPLGRLLSQTRAGGTMTFEYDEVGNQKKRIDYQGRETRYTHDKLNRLTEIEYATVPGFGITATPNLKSTYSYDDISRLTSAVNEAGTVSFGYDNRNRVISTTDVFGQTLNYEYELSPTANQKRLKLNGAMYAAYNLDDADRLANIVNSSDSTTISFGYDDEDKMTSRTYPNGVTTTYDYDNMDRLKRLKDTSSSTTLFDRQYGYNSANQIETITELTNSRTFGYDLVDRLKTVTASNNQNESYNFDDVGNRTTSHLSSSYGYQPFNKLASTQTATYNYDANGNMVSKSEGKDFWRYTWDYENRMGSASTRKQSVRYKYDALGRRVQRTVGGGKENTTFTYDGQEILLDNDSGTVTKYLNGPGIDHKMRMEKSGAASYFVLDHLGSTNALMDTNGVITSQASYDSFGNQTGNLATRYGFTGREKDSFTSLHHYRSRQYDSKLGRFMSEDPIGFGGGDINLYGYVGNRPLRFRDPFGLNPYDDEQLWRAQQDLINALAGPIEFGIGFGDNVLFGVSRYIRQRQGIDDPNLDCSVAYQAGGWTAFAVQIAAGGVGLYRGGIAIAANFGARGAATSSIANAVRVGAAGEQAVGIVGPKTAIEVAGRTRIPDRITLAALEEVKNVKHLNYTRQLRDYYTYAQNNQLDMILHVRSTTTFSGPLQTMIDSGQIIIRTIPGM